METVLPIIEQATYQSSITLSFLEGLTILIYSLIFGLYIRYLYLKFAITFSSKISFGNTLLIVTISVASLVAVVKASLALSLGLVGALSVIRFRTAVKEPYNLSFILLAICMAISIGASQYLFCLLVSFFGTLAILFSYKSNKSNSNKKLNTTTDEIDTIYLSLPPESLLYDLKELLDETTNYFSIISIDQEDKSKINLVINIKIENYEALVNLKNQIFKKFPGSLFKFYNTPSG